MIETLIPNPWVFVGLTLVIGGLAAAVTGHALAKGWRNPALVFAAMLPLAAGVRFLHFALFEEPLDLTRLALTAILLMLFGLAGFRATRQRQMAQCYPWLAKTPERA